MPFFYLNYTLAYVHRNKKQTFFFLRNTTYYVFFFLNIGNSRKYFWEIVWSDVGFSSFNRFNVRVHGFANKCALKFVLEKTCWTKLSCESCLITARAPTVKLIKLIKRGRRIEVACAYKISVRIRGWSKAQIYDLNYPNLGGSTSSRSSSPANRSNSTFFF